MDEDVVHIYNGIPLSHKKDGIMPYAVTWMQLDIIILSEIRKERQIPCDITYEWDLSNDTNEPTYETETQSLTEQTGGCQGRGVGEGLSGRLMLADVSFYIQDG